MDHEKTKERWKARRIKIVKLREEGKTFTEIGHLFLITRQRAEQIWRKETEK